MIRVCGASLGLFAFAITVLLGLNAGNPVETILARGVWALFLFCSLGLATGWVAWRTIDEHTQSRHREMFPVEGASPGATAPAPDGESGAAG